MYEMLSMEDNRNSSQGRTLSRSVITRSDQDKDDGRTVTQESEEQKVLKTEESLQSDPSPVV